MARVRSAKLIGKSYSSIQDMVDDVAPPDFSDNFRRSSAERDVVNQLMTRRGVAGMTTDDVAKKLGWSEESVEELEASMDRHLRLEDVKQYAKAIGCKIAIVPE